MIKERLEKLLPKPVWDVIWLFVYVFIYYMCIIPIHEFGHLYFLRLYGGDGAIYLTWWGAFVDFIKEPTIWTPYCYIVIAFMGGGAVALLFLILAILPPEYRPEESALAILGFSQFSYAIAEILWFFKLITTFWLVSSSIIGLTIGTIIGIYWLVLGWERS